MFAVQLHQCLIRMRSEGILTVFPKALTWVFSLKEITQEPALHAVLLPLGLHLSGRMFLAF